MGRFSAVLLLLLHAVLSITTPDHAEAQRNCRKGIPCGNTCISATKVCRIGSSTARTAEDRQAHLQRGPQLHQKRSCP